MRSPSGHPSQAPRPILHRAALGAAFAAAIVLVVAGCSAANAGSTTGGPTAAATPSAPIETMRLAPVPSIGPGVAASAPGQATAGGTGTTGGTGTASGSTVASIAYPYPGTSGVAPDHTIVVVGTGSATAATDAARATAQHDALLAALADARSQAEAIASATHVTIDGVLSVSASQSPYLVYPMGIEAPASGGTTPGAGAPDIQPPTAIAPQGPTMVTASVTVAYSIH